MPDRSGGNVVTTVGVEEEVFSRPDIEGEWSRSGTIEADARAIGGNSEGFRAIATVNFNGVDTGPSFIEVGAVAGVPDHPVVIILAKDRIIAGTAGENIVSGAAE